MQLGQSKSLEFYQVENFKEMIKVVDTVDYDFLAVFLRLDNRYNIFERRYVLIHPLKRG